MRRITNKDLQLAVDRLNTITDNKLGAYEKQENGQYKSNVGNYHLSYAYSGVSLHKMVNQAGGVQDVFRCGHIPKRDLYNRIWAFIDGMKCECR